MSSIDVLDARERLVDVGLCGDRVAEPTALLLDDLFDQALSGYVAQTTLDGLVEQWRAERAELAAQQAQFLAEIRKEINDFRVENNQRERERDERERQRAQEMAAFTTEVREQDHQRAQELAEFAAEMREREGERDERERQRDERERQRVRDQEERDAKLRNWVVGVVGLGFAATTLVSGLLVAFG